MSRLVLIAMLLTASLVVGSRNRPPVEAANPRKNRFASLANLPKGGYPTEESSRTVDDELNIGEQISFIPI
jgi:hypothetical protein